jgi:flagellar hook-associated protein 3 FlgL
VETLVSEIRDLDYAEAITRLQQELVTLQAAQQSFVRIQGLSLFQFLR